MVWHCETVRRASACLHGAPRTGVHGARGRCPPWGAAGGRRRAGSRQRSALCAPPARSPPGPPVLRAAMGSMLAIPPAGRVMRPVMQCDQRQGRAHLTWVGVRGTLPWERSSGTSRGASRPRTAALLQLAAHAASLPVLAACGGRVATAWQRFCRAGTPADVGQARGVVRGGCAVVRGCARRGKRVACRMCINWKVVPAKNA